MDMDQKLTHNDECYTPPVYIEAVKTVFGGDIDLDPASSETANLVVQAKQILTAENDGLKGDWHGRKQYFR